MDYKFNFLTLILFRIHGMDIWELYKNIAIFKNTSNSMSGFRRKTPATISTMFAHVKIIRKKKKNNALPSVYFYSFKKFYILLDFELIIYNKTSESGKN